MADKTMRLAQAAKKYNVGLSTIVDFLAGKGIEVSNKPTTKIDGQAIELLEQEYSDQAAIKQRADNIDIGSARRKVAEKPAEEQAALEKETPIQEEIPKQAEPVEEEKVKIEAPKAKLKVVGKINVEEQEAKTPKPEKAKEEKPAPKVEEKPKEKKVEEVEDKIETKSPKLKGTKVVDKIDIKEPKKPAEQKAEESPKEEQKENPKKAEPVQEEKATAKKEAELAQPEAEKPEESKKIETQYKELSGPKVLGKIDLPEKKRKRKRIVKKVNGEGEEKSTPNPNQRQNNNRNNNNRTNNNRNNNNNNNNNRRNRRKSPQEEQDPVSEQEIQEQIKATMARMQGKSSGSKGDRSKYKRQKRKDHAEARQEAQIQEELDNSLEVTEFIPLNELASLMDVAPTDLISACFSLGMMVTINQRLDAEVIQLLGEEFGYDIKFANVNDQIDDEEIPEDNPEDLEERTPIVTIMGHVDHGKTSLLDYIRDTNVIAGEAGGITQHIGAYEVELENGKNITFLDTPGHEAFTAMRARGSKVTDIAIIVIAADDSVMPQTKEAISHAQAAGVPMIFAFNKIDKPDANPDKVKEELSQMNILVEDWGGEYQSQSISAKTGQGIDELLEKVLLQAELLELKANPNKGALGTVLEAKLDKGRGYVASILIQEGTLRIGDFTVAGQNYGKVKAMFNERGKPKKEAGPSTPVELLGLNGAPTAGESVRVYVDEAKGKDVATRREQIMREQGLKARKHITLDEIGRRLALGNFKELNVIIKGDVDGSVEAMADSLQKLSTDEVAVNIIHKGVGPISESDILLASASDAVVIAFQVRPTMQARQLADKEDIEIRSYSVIYDAIDEIKSAMEGMLEPKVEENVICNIEVLDVFKISKVGTIAGCEVKNGKAKRDMKVRLIRDGIVVYSGEIDSLKRYKDDVKEVFAGQECGVSIKNYNDIKVGDIIEGYEEIQIKRKLGA